MIALERIAKGQHLPKIFAQAALDELRKAQKLTEKFGRKKRAALSFVIILFLTVILNLWSSIAFAQSMEWTKLKGGHFMAVSKEMYDKAWDIVSANDEQSFNSLLIARVIIKTVEGTDVYVEHLHPLHGSAEIRLKGDARTYWVIQKALYSMDSFDKETQPVQVNKQAGNICKLEGVMIENGHPAILISRHGKVDLIKVGDRVCGGEIIQIYPPGESGGVTSDQSADKYEYRIKVKIGEQEKVFKNGDIVCEEAD